MPAKTGGVSRRGYLRRAAATAATLTAATSVGAAEGLTGVKPAGIERPVKRLLRNRRWDQATDLLARKDVEFDHRVIGMPVVSNPHPDTPEDPPDGVSTQAEYNQANSKLAHTVYRVSGSIYRASLQWTLEYEGETLAACVDGAGPPDAASVGFSQTYWEPVIDSWRFGSNTSFYDRNPEGVIASFDDPDFVPLHGVCNGSLTAQIPSVQRRSGWFRVDIRKKQSGSHNVYGTYAHTWNPFNIRSGVSFSLSLGVLSVSTGTNTHYWRKRNDRNV